MRTVRVLQWDDLDFHTYTLKEKGVRVETVKLEVFFGSRYRVLPEICAKARRCTEAKEVDLVILGNNVGTGLANAKFIADAMKEKTIVVWYDYSLGQEAPYADMGFKHFCSRNDLEKLIPTVLGLA